MLHTVSLHHSAHLAVAGVCFSFLHQPLSLLDGWLPMGGLLLSRVTASGQHEVGVGDQEQCEGQEETGVAVEHGLVFVDGNKEKSLDQKVDQETGEGGGLTLALRSAHPIQLLLPHTQSVLIKDIQYTSYKNMGCGDISEVKNHSSTDQIKMQILKLKLTCELQARRTKERLQKLEKDLIALHLSKQPETRTRGVERAVIQGNAMVASQRNLYLHLESQALILNEHKYCFDSYAGIEEYSKSVNLLLYSSRILDCEDLTFFTDLFRKRFPDYKWPKDKDVDELAVSVNKGEVSFQFEKEYVFEMAQNYSITMEHINAVGHNYKYGATSYD